MQNASVLPLFPKMLQRVHFPFNPEQELASIEKLEWMPREDGSFISKRKDILHLPEFQRILSMCQRSVDYYVQTIMAWDIEVYITQSWVSRQPTGTRLQAHTHPNSFISGCIYFQNDSDSCIVFDDPYAPVIRPRVKHRSEFNGTAQFCNAAPGTLLIWPSTLQHRTQGNLAEKDRISLAFNTFVRGDLGLDDAATALHLD
jgi:uncharacterized protein (TIGR02466 family)